MKEYFILQYKMMNRRLKEQGLEPLLAYIILLVVFFGLSFYLFYKTSFAAYLYIFFALTFTGRFSHDKRTDFLKICFGDKKTIQIRAMENCIVVLPFCIFLLYKQLFLFAGLLPVAAALVSLLNFRRGSSFSLPTPFSKKPFEFSTGFRNSFYIIALAYTLSVIAVVVNNFNLGLAAVLLMYAITLSYYSKPENEYYVWVHQLNAKAFLISKIKTALLFSFLLVVPQALLLIIFFQQHFGIILLLLFLGSAYLVAMIAAKYSSYPDEMNLAQAMLLALCIGVPPMLLVVIPYLFFKSEKRLSSILK